MGNGVIRAPQHPVIFDAHAEPLARIEQAYEITRRIDTYKDQLEDLFLIRNPRYRFDTNYREELTIFVEEHSGQRPLSECGRWVYFPWSKALVHYLEDELHQEIRTARNRNLISKEEQDRFYNCAVGVAGLSVGSHGAMTIALMGGGRVMKLADPDVVSASNLNRLRCDFTQIGMNKADVIAQYVYQLNPYAELHLYRDGINEGNAGEFLDELDVLIEELDDIEMKVRMREEAKKRKIPVVMVTDNGDNVIIDIERFDEDSSLPVFHGRLEGFDTKGIKGSPQRLFEAMAKIIDISLVPTKVLHSVLEVGKTIYSWPQLASAATLSGAVVAYAVRKIALGERLRDGKLQVNVDAVLDPEYEKNRESRERELRAFVMAADQR